MSRNMIYGCRCVAQFVFQQNIRKTGKSLENHLQPYSVVSQLGLFARDIGVEDLSSTEY